MATAFIKKKQIQKDQRNYRRHLKEIDRANSPSFNSKREEKIHRFNLNHQYSTFNSRKETYFKSYGDFIIPGSGSLIINIPEKFTFCNEYAKCMSVIKIFASSLFDYIGHKITINFGNCRKADTPALFVLQILRLEMLGIVNALQEKFPLLHLTTDVIVIPSKTPDVIRLLMSTGYPVNLNKISIGKIGPTQMIPIHQMGYFKGKSSQQHIRENRKPVVTEKVVEYVNKCLGIHQYQLTEDDKNSLGGIMGEVLSNCEDHSLSDAWFITANFSVDLKDSADTMIGELNLTILNFGLSFFEAFEKTKKVNGEVFSLVKNLVDSNRLRSPNMIFNDEQLYTLIMMSDQVSRLKYKEESRGTGTMKFINSFIELGNFEEKSQSYLPNLSIFTGYTHMICDNELKPFSKGTVFCLSLNPEKDLNVPPRESHLRVLHEKFPGKLMSVKIYFNKKHLDKKYGGHNNEDN